jgi:hypothetical protein
MLMADSTCTPRTTKCVAKDHFTSSWHINCERDNAIQKLNIISNSPLPGGEKEIDIFQ